MAEKLLLRPDEAADALSLGRSKLYEMLQTGELRSVRAGRARRVPVEALREWISAQTDEPTAA